MSTIARFRADFADAVTVLFGQVLMLCARLGMGKLGTVALDGSKVRANASKAANRTEETLAKLAAGRVAAHAETDAEEDALFGQARGDEVPAAAADPYTRDERIDAALASAAAERARRERQRAEQAEEQAAKAAEYLAAARAGTPKAGQPPAGTAVALAQAKVAREMAAQQAKCEQWERRGRSRARPGGGRPVPPEQYCRVRKAQAKLAAARAREAGAARKAAQAAAKDAVIVRNVTDPDSRLMATRNGKQQCYNPQQVVSEDLLVIATELTDDPTDMAWFEPMMDQAQDAAALILAHQPPAPRSARPGQRDRAGAGRCRVPVPAQPHLPRPGPADRHRQAPRPGKSSPRYARRQPGHRPGRRRRRRRDRRDGRPAGHRRRHHRLPAARPHRRDPARRHQAQHALRSAVPARQAQSRRGMDIRLRRPQPAHRHQQRPPHPPTPSTPSTPGTAKPARPPAPPSQPGRLPGRAASTTPGKNPGRQPQPTATHAAQPLPSRTRPATTIPQQPA